MGSHWYLMPTLSQTAFAFAKTRRWYSEVFEKIAANHVATGYGDTGKLQPEMMQRGNEAAAKYPKLDRIIRAEIIG